MVRGESGTTVGNSVRWWPARLSDTARPRRDARASVLEPGTPDAGERYDDGLAPRERECMHADGRTEDATVGVHVRTLRVTPVLDVHGHPRTTGVRGEYPLADGGCGGRNGRDEGEQREERADEGVAERAHARKRAPGYAEPRREVAPEWRNQPTSTALCASGG